MQRHSFSQRFGPASVARADTAADHDQADELAHARQAHPGPEADTSPHAHRFADPAAGAAGSGHRPAKERGRKTLPIPPELVAELRAHRDAQFLQKLTVGDEWEDRGLVFCQWNGRPLDPRQDWQERADILVAAKLPRLRSFSQGSRISAQIQSREPEKQQVTGLRLPKIHDREPTQEARCAR